MFLTQMDYPYTVRREQYRREPWYVMVKKDKGSLYCVVRDFSDVFPEELLGMPPYREVEFFIDPLPRTTPTFKRPYRRSVEELKELKKQLT
jgi:hypothetical protein